MNITDSFCISAWFYNGARNAFMSKRETNKKAKFKNKVFLTYINKQIKIWFMHKLFSQGCTMFPLTLLVHLYIDLFFPLSTVASCIIIMNFLFSIFVKDKSDMCL